MNQPIPTTARLPVEYIPTPQDAERYEREKRKAIAADQRALAALETALKSEESRANEGKPDALKRSLPDTPEIISRRQAIVDEIGFMERNIATMRETYPTPQRFFLQVPTSVEREQINSRLISLGLTQVTQEMIRATMIEELFEQDWGKGSTEANEVEAEAIANFLDGVWQRSEAHDIAIQRWQEQELERTLDEAAGAPSRPRADLPPKIITVRENARMTLLIDRMMKASQKLRDLAASNADFGRRNAILLVRIHVVKVEGIDIAIERDPVTNALPEATVLALREKVDDGSWNDLVGFIDRMYRLDGYEEKNSDSPLGKLSDLTGSTAPIGDTASSDGNSTISSISPAPAAGSETIIEPSFGSTSAIGLARPNMGESNSPTGEA